MAHRTKFAGLASLAAAASLALIPAQAQAAEVTPQGSVGYTTSFLANLQNGTALDSSRYDVKSETVEHRRRFRRGFRGRGFRGRRFRGRGFRGFRHRRGIRGRDLFAGALVIGGIAAIASANNRRRDRDVVIVERDNRRFDDRRFDDRRSTRRSNSGSGIDGAVDQCLDEIERDVRVDSVDGASRVAEGWVVTGTLFNGSGFTCQIDNNGRISNVDFAGEFSGGPLGATDGQLSDERYAEARAVSDG